MVTYSTNTLEGNTWDGLTVKINNNDTPIPLENAQARMVWREGSVKGPVVYEMTNPEQLQINDPGEVVILPILIEFIPGVYVADLTLTTTEVKTYLRLTLTVDPSTNGDS